jgi:hypothetical protein
MATSIDRPGALVMIGQAFGFGPERSQAFPIGRAGKVSAQPVYTLRDVRLFEQMFHAPGTGVAELKTQPFTAGVGKPDFPGEAVKGIVHDLRFYLPDAEARAICQLP